MLKLFILYCGTVLLAFLSQHYNPLEALTNTSRMRHFIIDKSDPFLIAIILWLTFFNGLKTSYNDTGIYIRTFRNSVEGFWAYWSANPDMGFMDNPLYYSVMAAVKGLIDNYHVWFLLVAFLNAFAIIKLFKHYSESLPFSILIFLAVGTYVMYLAAMKQSVAIAILMIAIPFLLERKWIPYYLLVFLAILFHAHAFMFLAMPLFLVKPWGKVTWICVILVALSMATYSRTLGAFMEYAQLLGANVAEIEVFDGHAVNPLRVVVYSIPALLMLIFRRRLFRDSTVAENLFGNMSILSALILSIGLVEGGNLFARMAGYFEW